ncbi:MAG: DNA polymerase III subunit delta [Bryobacteraceae bacterium]
MTSAQLLRELERRPPPPLLLLAGPEDYLRRRCRQALIEKCLAPEERDGGFVRHDLEEISLADVLDDARSFSLFAPRRLIWVSSAEAALPRGRAAEAAEEAGSGAGGADAELLAAYAKDPPPGVTLVFDARRWDFEGEDKARMERLLKFYAPAAVVELRRLDAQEAVDLAMELASERGLKLGRREAEMLATATACDGMRLATEIEKLSLYCAGRPVSAADIAALVPDAEETTVFGLVDALARRDRGRALHLLDVLLRGGEYLPLALMFLEGVFRMALAAREQKLRSAQEVQSFFQRMGMPMWRARAEQVFLAASRFSSAQLAAGIGAIFEADSALKSTRPDDRLVMEQFILRLTA